MRTLSTGGLERFGKIDWNDLTCAAYRYRRSTAHSVWTQVPISCLVSYQESTS